MAAGSASREVGGFRLRGGAVAGLTLGLLLLISTWQAAPAHAALHFERCAEAGAEDWECATHTVPLDWSGKAPGAIELEVRRYRPPGSPDPSAKLPFVALAGGPGQSATDVADLFPRALAPALADYQLIVYDQRGTGLSSPLYCPALKPEELEGDGADLLSDISRKTAARCAEQLGAKRAFYTTLDSARDIDSIRQALDAPRVGIGGVSYGTYVSAVFAQQYPERTDRIVLVSVVLPTGLSTFGLDSFEAIPRVLDEQCEGGRCAGVTPAPVGDLRRIVGQVPARDQELLFLAIVQGDFNPPLRGGQPAAFRSYVKGDEAPLERFVKLAVGADDQDEAADAGGSGEDELAQKAGALSS